MITLAVASQYYNWWLLTPQHYLKWVKLLTELHVMSNTGAWVLAIYVILHGQLEWLYSHCWDSDKVVIWVYGNQTQPGLVSLKSYIFNAVTVLLAWISPGHIEPFTLVHEYSWLSLSAQTSQSSLQRCFNPWGSSADKYSEQVLAYTKWLLKYKTGRLIICDGVLLCYRHEDTRRLLKCWWSWVCTKHCHFLTAVGVINVCTEI